MSSSPSFRQFHKEEQGLLDKNQKTRDYFLFFMSRFCSSGLFEFSSTSMTQPMEQQCNDQNNAVKQTEVFVGGLPRSISEETVHEVFSSCGQIVEIRMIKDNKGSLKGFCFVKFATKEAAARAISEKSGLVLDGKKIGVLPSSEQNTLYFGSLSKAWSAEEFERLVHQVFEGVESVDLAMVKDATSGQKKQNRGFAFVKFSSHAAAARAQRVGSQPNFRLGNVHPAVQWAEEEIDPEELAKMKVAFIRNLPVDANENYLKHLFEPFGKVDKVALTRKGRDPIGFVHFTERSDLERAIVELNEKTVQGPSGTSMHKLQVEVSKPMNRNKKRVRENSASSSVPDHRKLLKVEPGVSLSNNHGSHIQREVETADPYLDALVALSSPVKERLLRILRLGIATRFDIEISSLNNLNELPESTAITILDQFMLTGASLPNKRAYLAAVISKHLVDRMGFTQSLGRLPRVMDTANNEYKLFSLLHQAPSPAVTSHAHSTVARPDMYSASYSSQQSDYPLSSRTLAGRMELKGATNLLPHPSLRRDNEKEQEEHRLLSGSQSYQIPAIRNLGEGSHSPFETTVLPSLSYTRDRLRIGETQRFSPMEMPSLSTSYFRQHGTSSSSDHRRASGPQESHPQMRFDPFTGEPYRFDPFTGEPILPVDTTEPF